VFDRNEMIERSKHLKKAHIFDYSQTDGEKQRSPVVKVRTVWPPPEACRQGSADFIHHRTQNRAWYYTTQIDKKKPKTQQNFVRWPSDTRQLLHQGFRHLLHIAFFLVCTFSFAKKNILGDSGCRIEFCESPVTSVPRRMIFGGQIISNKSISIRKTQRFET